MELKEILKGMECCTTDNYTCAECPFLEMKHRDLNGNSEIMDEQGTRYDRYDCCYWLMKMAFEYLKKGEEND